jgi:hypothetical protein
MLQDRPQFPLRPYIEPRNEEAAFAASVLPGELENFRHLADGDVPRDSSADLDRLRLRLFLLRQSDEEDPAVRFHLTDGSPALVRDRLDTLGVVFLNDPRPGLLFESGREKIIGGFGGSEKRPRGIVREDPRGERKERMKRRILCRDLAPEAGLIGLDAITRRPIRRGR